jgi:hypothetical protein
VNFDHREHKTYKITAHHKSADMIYIDEITNKLFDPPKRVTVHTIIFGSQTDLFYLYIPESSGHAILFRPSQMMDSSWVEMRFGKCRKLK